MKWRRVDYTSIEQIRLTEDFDVSNRKGDMPELDDDPEVPDIPDYALPDGAGKKKKSSTWYDRRAEDCWKREGKNNYAKIQGKFDWNRKRM